MFLGPKRLNCLSFERRKHDWRNKTVNTVSPVNHIKAGNVRLRWRETTAQLLCFLGFDASRRDARWSCASTWLRWKQRPEKQFLIVCSVQRCTRFGFGRGSRSCCWRSTQRRMKLDLLWDPLGAAMLSVLDGDWPPCLHVRMRPEVARLCWFSSGEQATQTESDVSRLQENSKRKQSSKHWFLWEHAAPFFVLFLFLFSTHWFFLHGYKPGKSWVYRQINGLNNRLVTTSYLYSCSS